MQEFQVTVDGETRILPSPFIVMATQNPIEQEGTYPLPEAQLDRFLLNVLIEYPSIDNELNIMRLVRDETLNSSNFHVYKKIIMKMIIKIKKI